MAYFRNNVVNLLNLHYGIFALAMTGGGAFFCVYLLRAGVPLPGVLVSMAAIMFARFAVRPIVPILAVKFGLQPLLVAGTILIGIQLLVLAGVHGIGPGLFFLIAISALGDAIYWSSYHAYFATLGDHEHRGHQVGAREALAALSGIVSPIITGWTLVTFGPYAAFGLSCVATLGATVPLLWTPNVVVAPEIQGAFKASMFGVKMFAIDGWIQSGFVFVWQIALFVSLKQSFINFGGALALAAVVGAVASLLLGRHIDSGGGGRAVLLAICAMTMVVLLRAVSFGHPWLAIAANALAPIGACLYTPTLMTAVYNEAKRAPCTLRFHVATEGGWDFGGATGSLAAAALLWAGVPISLALLLPLIGLIASFRQLRRYFASNAISQLVNVPVQASVEH